jgi:voltage-gated potassium channel
MIKSYPQFRTFKERINFYFEDIETSMGMAFDLVVISLVVLVSAIFVIETYNISSAFRQILDLAEAIIVSIFVLEYLLRFWVAKNKIRHFFSVYSLIDLLAILPFFFAAHLEFLRMFRAFRFLRILRFYRSHQIIGHLTNKDVFITSRLFFTLFTIIFVSAGFLYPLEHSANPEKFSNFFDAFYFSFIAMTTVGFGDIVPVTDAGRVITILMISSGFIFIPWQLGEFIRRIIRSSS